MNKVMASMMHRTDHRRMVFDRELVFGKCNFDACYDPSSYIKEYILHLG